MDKKKSDSNFSVLRKRAEEIIQGSSVDVPDNLSPEDARSLIHELRVYQEELEIQNEQLRQAQLDLEKARARYFDLYELAPVGYLMLDEQAIILEVNLTATSLLGLEKDQIVKQPLNCFIASDTQDTFYLNFKKVLKTGAKKVYEMKMINKNGCWFWVQVEMTAALKYESQDNTYRVVISDITERKKAEEIIKSNYEFKRRADKLESLSILASGIAHDFNNYLATLQGNISLARIYKDKPDKVEGKLKNMESVIDRTTDLTQQLFLFATGGTTDKKKVYIKKLINDSVHFALSGSNVCCHLSLPDSLYAVEIDEGQITQVMYNIIINAVQAMSEGGAIHVSAENFIIETPENENLISLPEGKYVKISIADEGPGIPEKFLQKIYDPFFTSKVEGSGLGLSTSYSIIKNHNGYIQVETEEGKGTIFNIFLPAFTQIDVANTEEKDIIYGSGKILIMDDDKEVRSFMGEVLITLGYEVLYACEGIEVLEMYMNSKKYDQPIDLVVMDLTISNGMGAKNTINKLFKKDPEAKAIVSSGYANDPVLNNFREYGFKGAIKKPYNIKELSEVIYGALKDIDH